jgi:hypothetical protein
VLPELDPDDEPELEEDPPPELDPDEELVLPPEPEPDEPDDEPELDPEEPDEEPDEEPEDDPDEPPEPDPDPLVIPELPPLLELDSTMYFVVPLEQAAAAIARHTGTPSSQLRTSMRSPPRATPLPSRRRPQTAHAFRGLAEDHCATMRFFPGDRDAQQALGAARCPFPRDGDRAVFVPGRILTFLGVGAAIFATACGSSSHAAGDGDASPGDAAVGMDATDDSAEEGGAAITFNVFDHVPQFGIYVGHDPANYTPPAGVLMWAHGTMFVTKLTAAQQALIGSDLAARITYHAQCDNYDRLGGIFFVRVPPGQTPTPNDPQTELVRFITPFSDFTEAAHATLVYPDADLSAYAQVLADPTHDIWVGIAGGSNPYSMDPCVALAKPADFQAIGFLYSLDFVSHEPLVRAPSTVFSAFVSDPGARQSTALPPQAIADLAESSTPIHGTFDNQGGPLTGHVTVIVSGHGSGAGGDEYEFTDDTVTVGGKEVGLFSTKIDCAPYAALSPDGNPGIFQGNASYNPRNWCPGALVPSHTFPVSLPGWTRTPVALGVTPGQVPMGSEYSTSITFSAP